MKRIVYDFSDTTLITLLKPSIEEVHEFTDQEACLDYIAKRGTSLGISRDKRINYARDVFNYIKI